MEEIKDIYFEELEKAEELSDISDFAAAAAPWIIGGTSIVVALAT